MPFRKLFLSRWAALLWAAGIVWTAIDVVGFGPPASQTKASANAPAAPGDSDATGVTVDPDDLAVLANALKT